MTTVYETYVHEEDAHHVCRIALSLEKGFYQKDLGQINPWSEEWNLEEDRLLVGFEHDAPPDEEWVDAYEQQAAEHPELFRKTNVSLDAMKMRLYALQTSPVESRIYQMLKRSGKEKEAAIQAANQTTLAEMKKALDKSKAEARDGNVRIACDASREVVGNETLLAKASRRMSMVLGAQAPGADGYKRISLNSEVSPIPNTPAYGAFDEATVRLFSRLSEKPNYGKHKADLEEKIEKVKKLQDVSWMRYGEETSKRRHQRIADVEAARKEETAALIAASDAWLLQDIKALTAAHHAHRKVEQTAIDRRYDQQLREIDTFYAMQQTRIRDLSAAYEKYVDEYGLLIEQQRVVNETIAELYTVGQVPKLLILAEVVQADDIKDLLIQMTADQATAHFLADDKALSCQLLRSNTIQEIISKISDMDLATLSGHAACVVHEDFIQNEVRARVAAFEDELMMKDDAAVMELAERAAAGTLPSFFQGTVRKEWSRREARKGGGVDGGAEEQGRCPVRLRRQGRVKGGMLIHPHGTTVEGVDGDRKYHTALGTHGKCGGEESGRCYWEAVVDQLDASQGNTVAIGWESVLSSENTLPSAIAGGGAGAPLFAAGVCIPGLVPGENGLHGAMLTSDGMLRSGGAAADALMCIERGDVIGVGLDLTVGEFAFYKNGIPIPKAAGSFDGGQAFHVVPAVTLYTCRADVRSSISVTFSPPFRHLPSNHAPYFPIIA